jgi:hypothetical protein
VHDPKTGEGNDYELRKLRRVLTALPEVIVGLSENAAGQYIRIMLTWSSIVV